MNNFPYIPNLPVLSAPPPTPDSGFWALYRLNTGEVTAIDDTGSVVVLLDEPENGLYKDGKKVGIGGDLNQDTAINGAYSLEIGSTTKLTYLDFYVGNATENSNFYMDNYEITLSHQEPGGINAYLALNTSESSLSWQNTTKQSVIYANINGIGVDTEFNGARFAYLKNTNLTTDRTFEFPNSSGTLALTDDLEAYLPLTLSGNATVTQPSSFSLTFQALENIDVIGKYNTNTTYTQRWYNSDLGSPLFSIRNDGNVIMSLGIRDTSGDQVIDIPGRTFNDDAGNPVFSANDFSIYPGIAYPSASFGTRILKNSSNITKLDWENLLLDGNWSVTGNFNIGLTTSYASTLLSTKSTGNTFATVHWGAKNGDDAEIFKLKDNGGFYFFEDLYDAGNDKIMNTQNRILYGMAGVSADRIDIENGALYFGGGIHADWKNNLLNDNWQVVDGDFVLSNQAKAFYIGATATDGSWRHKIDSADLIFEKRESGVWTEKFRISA